MAILLLRSMGGQQPDALSFNTAIAAAPWPIATLPDMLGQSSSGFC